MSVHSKTTQILKGATSYFASSVANAAATFLISLIVSWYLGKEGLGVLSVSFAIILIGVVVSELGLNPLIIREFSTSDHIPLLSFRSIILARLTASAIVSVCLFLAIPFFIPNSLSSVLIAGSAILIVSKSVGSGIENLLKAKFRHVPYLILTLVSTIVQVLSVYVVMNRGHGVGEVLLTLALTDILRVAALMFLTRDEMPAPQATNVLSRIQRKQLLAQCAPFVAIGVLSLLNERADILLLAKLRDTGEAGLFAAADRFLVIGNLVDSSLFASTLPILVPMKTESDRGRVTSQLLKATLIFSAVASVALFLAAPLLIKATFRFSESVLVLQILSLSFPAMLVNRMLRTALYSLRRERTVAAVLGISGIGSIVLNVAFIPMYGAMGAAIVTVVTECSLAVMYGMLYRKRVGMLACSRDN